MDILSWANVFEILVKFAGHRNDETTTSIACVSHALLHDWGHYSLHCHSVTAAIADDSSSQYAISGFKIWKNYPIFKIFICFFPFRYQSSTNWLHNYPSPEKDTRRNDWAFPNEINDLTFLGMHLRSHQGIRKGQFLHGLGGFHQPHGLRQTYGVYIIVGIQTIQWC